MAISINMNSGLTPNAKRILERRYLIRKDEKGNVLEEPEDMFRRMDVKLAELIGYFVGHGCFHKGKLMLAIPHDSLELKDYFDIYIRSAFAIVNRSEQESKNRSINLIYHSQMLVKWLKSIGVDKEDSLRAFIPFIIFYSFALF